MNSRNCLFCYQPLDVGGSEFHASCSLKMFGSSIPPELDYTNDQMLKLAEKVVLSQQTITGVQAKLSLGLSDKQGKNKPRKLTITGLWGGYILKPPSDYYQNLPELEGITMYLAEVAGLNTVPQSLIRLASGELAYLTKRIDREAKQKFHMEDMCQITERMTEAKYRGSYEQIAKAIARHSARPGLDIIRFYELVVFCFLTGNNDMHLKNFSMFRGRDSRYLLSPAYDLVAATLVVEGDDEELALTLNGKKRKLKAQDFEQAFRRANLPQRVGDNIFVRFFNITDKWNDAIERSFLPIEMKTAFKDLVQQRLSQLKK